MQEFTAVVFEKYELELRDISELKSILPLLAHQDFNSDVDSFFEMPRNDQFASSIKVSLFTPWLKKKN